MMAVQRRIYRKLSLLCLLLMTQIPGATATDIQESVPDLGLSVQTSLLPDTSNTNENAEVVTADTGESLLYLGRKLVFEARKRLNLTSEEEEKKEEKKKEYTLRIFGVVYEKNK